MFNLAEYRTRPDRLTDLLPWAVIIRPGIILNKDGSFQQTLKFRGPDLESSTEPQLVSATARLNNALKRLGSGWAVFVEARRQQALKYPDPSTAHFPDPVSLLIDAERRDLFEREQENYESHYYLTLQYLPPREAASKMTKWFVSGKQESGPHDYEKTIDFFISTVARLHDILKDFMYELSLLDDRETLTYLHSCISTKQHPVRVPELPVYLDAILADQSLTAGLEPMLGDHYLRTVSIMGFPSTSIPAILDQLNHLPIEYRWVSRYLPLDKVDAEKILKTYKRQWFSKRKGLMNMLSEVFSKTESAMVDTASMRKAQDADVAIQALADDHVSFGYYTVTVTVWDKDYDAAYEKQREVERVINGLGFTTIHETINAVEAWLSSLPGHVYANVRMPIIHSLNLAHMMPFSAVWAGPDYNQHLHAPALLYARTTGNTPFRLSNHIGDVGHQMIIGPTGAGKSVLMNLMAFQFLRYKEAQVFIFDKGGSFLAATLGAGGHYYEVGSTDPTEGLVFQPLARIDRNDERVWAQDWVLGIIANEKIEISPETKETIWDALTNLSNVPVNQRTLTGLKALIQDTRIRLALDSYTLGGPYGEILDADHEVFYKNDWQCFEMEHLMQMPDVVAPVLSYIFHVLEQRFTGRPTLMILDEAWLFLDHPMFAAKIREWLKTLRKLNVSVIFATQSVDDTLNSSISSALIESCPSRIYLPNDRALEPNVRNAYEQLGLNERQIQILANAIPKRQYYFESHKGNALFDLGLGELTLAFCGVSRPNEKKQIKVLWEQHGPRWFVPAYLRHAKLEWALQLMNQSADEQGAVDE
jgi:type IV secretion/conjugal transfer VirB4 family ATPase